MTKLRPAPFPLLALLSILSLSGQAVSAAEPAALADIEVMDFVSKRSEGTAELSGPWYFVPGVFLDPESRALPPSAVRVGAPSNVASYLEDGARFGTYVARVRLPIWEGSLSIKAAQFETAFRLYVDGIEVAKAGVPGANKGVETPGWSASCFSIPAEALRDRELILVIHASSYGDRFMGFSSSFSIGRTTTLDRIRTRRFGWDLFTTGIMAIMGFYFLLAWLFRPATKTALAFSCLCFSLFSRPLLYGEFPILDLLPGLSWDLILRAGYLTMSLPMIAAPLFFRVMFPRSVPRFLAAIGVSAGVLFSAAILVLDPLLFSSILVIAQIIVVALCVAFLACVVAAMIRREPSAWVISVGFLALAASIVLDILSAQAIISLPALSALGLITLIFSLSAAVTKSYADTLSHAEALAAELGALNVSMRRFVPAEFLVRLGKSGIGDVRLGDNVEVEMAVMFADIRSFTRHAEELGPNGAFAFLNAWLGRMGPVIRAHGGFVDKYLGDGILALFPPDGESALRCAAAMRVALADFNEDRTASGFQPVAMGIGLHRGRLVLGTIGEPERMDTTVIADTVNIAARLENVTKDFGVPIAVSAELVATADASAHDLRYLGGVTVKGCKAPVGVFELFDGDEASAKARKYAIGERFAKGLELFLARDFQAALPLFQSLVDEMPEDEPSRYYARMSRKLGG